MTDKIAYKVLTKNQWLALSVGEFRGAPIDMTDGFVHLSTATQLNETLARHFSGQQDLIIAAIDIAALGDAVRWEPSRQGQLFPHLYGPLTYSVVTEWCSLERDGSGRVRLPGERQSKKDDVS